MFDIGGAILSFRDLVRNPSWKTGAIFAYDLGSIFVPFVPGTATGRLAVKVVSHVNPKVFKGVTFRAGNAAKNLAKLTGKPPKGYNAHHIILQAAHGRLKDLGSKIAPNSPNFMTWWKDPERNSAEHIKTWQKIQR